MSALSTPPAGGQPPALTPADADHRAVPAHARQLAAQLSALFDHDVELVKRLNDAHHRLATANDQHWSGPAPDTLGHTHWQIHRAFCAYQDTSEQRRQLAFEVGERSQQLTHALCAAGWTAQEARQANVHQLAQTTPPKTPPQPAPR